MNKIGIITLYGESNFGNKLQNYAVHKCVSSFGVEPETIVDVCVVRMLLSLGKKWIKIILKKQCKPDDNKIARENKFKKFTLKYITTKKKYSFFGNFTKRTEKEYKYFVVGSDQIWCPKAFRDKRQYINRLLAFTSSEKKLCFAPSISMNEIPDEWKEKYAECLKTFPEINVRERRGAEIIEELTGKKAEVFIDPTLMLTKEEWEEVSSKSVGQGKKYILEYFLGNSDEKDEEILGKYAIDGIERINILDINNPESYASGPAEFIDLIKNAELVYTDSFHACVFSIIFDTPFIIKRRDDNLIDMFSRIETLFELFEIDKQCIEKSVPVVVDNVKKEEILSREREKVNRYFNKYLGN